MKHPQTLITLKPYYSLQGDGVSIAIAQYPFTYVVKALCNALRGRHKYCATSGNQYAARRCSMLTRRTRNSIGTGSSLQWNSNFSSLHILSIVIVGHSTIIKLSIRHIYGTGTVSFQLKSFEINWKTLRIFNKYYQ